MEGKLPVSVGWGQLVVENLTIHSGVSQGLLYSTFEEVHVVKFIREAAT